MDFGTARLLDGKWWQRTRILVGGMRRRTDAKIIDANYRFQLALIGNGNLTPGSFDKTQQLAKEQYFNFVGALKPWEGKDYTARMAGEFSDWRQEYIDAFGADPYDPAFKAWEAAQIARIEAESMMPQQQTAEERLLAKMHATVMKR